METEESRREIAERERWFSLLRERLMEIAARRVQPADVEDVVQAAMGIIAQKGFTVLADEVEGQPPIGWCLTVLRNTIGNHYKRARVRRDREDSSYPLELQSVAPEISGGFERVRQIEECLEALGRTDPQCGDYLQRTADGAKARELAAREGLAAAALYKRLFVCRQKLRRLLQERGLLPQ